VEVVLERSLVPCPRVAARDEDDLYLSASEISAGLTVPFLSPISDGFHLGLTQKTNGKPAWMLSFQNQVIHWPQVVLNLEVGTFNAGVLIVRVVSVGGGESHRCWSLI